MKRPKKPKTPRTDRKRKAAKKIYKVRDWHTYNEMLVNRGRLMVHITPDALKHWHDPGKRQGCRPRLYSDIAIETSLTMQQCFRLPLRATEGLVAQMLRALNSTCKAPDYSTLCLRTAHMPVRLRVRSLPRDEPQHLVVDASGVKVFGEGEWKVHRRELSKYRTWEEVHLALDERGDIISGAVTDVTYDGVVLPELLDQVPERTRNIVPGTPIMATTTLSVTTNDANGYNIALSGTNKNSTNNNLQLGVMPSIQIPDQTEWVNGAATT